MAVLGKGRKTRCKLYRATGTTEVSVPVNVECSVAYNARRKSGSENEKGLREREKGGWMEHKQMK